MVEDETVKIIAVELWVIITWGVNSETGLKHEDVSREVNYLQGVTGGMDQTSGECSLC